MIDSTSIDTFSDEAATLGVDNKTLTLTDTTYKYWDKTTLVVEKDAVALDSSSYSIHIGVVTFNQEQTAGTYTISGSYYDIEQCGGFFEYSIDAKMTLIDSTEFGDSWVNYEPGLLSWSAESKKFWIDEVLFEDLGAEIIVVFYLDTTTTLVYEGFAILEKDSITADVNKLIEESISFKGNGILSLSVGI